eukprot:TRINITY_DN75794_c0_g1_i1.p1 TRINITY_DN75794_c0_g1~~TRINITY_DN75794_c0_g1_i1.p1  ORF type:complete len:477 (-),score=88.46 TRINITY_DN75794_c0_g1_i1:65-1495(-)
MPASLEGYPRLLGVGGDNAKHLKEAGVADRAVDASQDDPEDGELLQCAQVWSQTGLGWMDGVLVPDDSAPDVVYVEFRVPGVGLCRKRLPIDSPKLKILAHKRSRSLFADSMAATGHCDVAEEDEAEPLDGEETRSTMPVESCQEGSEETPGLLPQKIVGVAPDKKRPVESMPQVTSGDQDADGELEQGVVLGSLWRLHRMVGCGSFGSVHHASNTRTGEKVALKVEPVRANFPQLREEYKRLSRLAGGPGIPIVHQFFSQKGHNVMVMELLGGSLQVLLERVGGRFSVETTCYLAVQMLTTVEFVHSKDIIHRDIKPQNFAMGIAEKRNTVHMIDFGLAKSFRDREARQHIPFRTGRPFVGTMRFASIGAQQGCEVSRRDDVQAIGYVLVYMLRGWLPWQGVRGETKEARRQQVLILKEEATEKDLAQNCPKEFELFLRSAARLRFEQTPAYESFRAHFQGLIEQRGGAVFDWQR